jgi:DNA mismatch repair ATPase MutS
MHSKQEIITTLKSQTNSLISVFEVPIDPAEYLSSELNIQSIQSFGKALEGGRLHATALLFNYIKHSQKTQLSNIAKIGLHSENKKILLDDVTIKNLEIFNSSYE